MSGKQDGKAMVLKGPRKVRAANAATLLTWQSDPCIEPGRDPVAVHRIAQELGQFLARSMLQRRGFSLPELLAGSLLASVAVLIIRWLSS